MGLPFAAGGGPVSQPGALGARAPKYRAILFF